MSTLRPVGRANALVVVLAAVMAASTLAGCGLLKRRGSQGTGAPPTVEPASSFGPCLPTYGSEVEAAAISGSGNRILYLSGAKPANWDDEAQPWRRGDKALYVLDRLEDGGQILRHIAVSWEAVDVLPEYATAAPDSQPRPVKLPEEMANIWLAKNGDRFVVAVRRKGVEGRYAKLYAGTVPAEGVAQLRPEEGLTLIPINDYKATEGIRSVELSEDGSRLAAIVGTWGDLRVFDLDAHQLSVYALNEDGETVVQHDLPPAPTSLDAVFNPAIAGAGVMRVTWSPDGSRLALARNNDVPGQTSLYIVEVATGQTTLVRRFVSSTVPHVAWASDGQSLFVMTTPLTPARLFGDTEIRRLAAAENGREVTAGGRLSRPLGYRTEPAFLTPLGDDEHFLFVWEKALWRLTAPGGNPARASYIQLTPDSYQVVYAPPTVSAAAERAVFIAQTGTRSFVGERTDVLADVCPRLATPTPAGQESPATEEAPAEATESSGS